jgi:hypothetical protein
MIEWYRRPNWEWNVGLDELRVEERIQFMSIVRKYDLSLRLCFMGQRQDSSNRPQVEALRHDMIIHREWRVGIACPGFFARTGRTPP